jgi:hypothetical protein
MSYLLEQADDQLTSERHARLRGGSTMAKEVAEVHDGLDAVRERAGLRIISCKYSRPARSR